ncbi:MAG: Rpp14/Pop5 family protein [Candidatus Verstraetearchaeota archaeon]|nr:Rpp14/Pop5 family protein [Candidatus Verstraetearchaeota archaeon]
MPVRGIRRRYLAVLYKAEKPLQGSLLFKAIQAQLTKLFGEYTASRAQLRLIHVDNSVLVIRCSHLFLQHVRSAIASTRRVEEAAVVAEPILVSGTIRTLREKLKSLLEGA